MTTLRPTRVRYLVVAVTAFAALWMYIDRVCFSTLAPDIGAELGIEDGRLAWVLGAFFGTYALFQVPIGMLADRFGPRAVLTTCIVAWSLCTAVTSATGTAVGLLAVRLCLGVCESGAYPAAAGLVRQWSSPRERGLLSSIVALGGRIGGAVAPALTAWAAVTWLGNSETKESNWRAVFLLYGVLGLVAAGLFWFVVRDTPARHPRANAAEAARVPPNPRRPTSLIDWLMQLLAVVVSRNMWLFGATQAFVNIGWVFLITSMPGYLKERFQVTTQDVGAMQTVTLTASCVGVALGGLFTDLMYRALGPRWGRAVPIAVCLAGCAVAYVVAIRMPTAWGVIAALTVMAFLVDLGIPSIWAFAQDVGGRQVGAALGWGNMWGNLAALFSPKLLWFLHMTYGWNAAFAVCAGCFLCGAGTGLSLNALVPITPKEPPEADDYREPG